MKPAGEEEVRGAVVAVDIGGTKMAAAIVDADGQLHARRQVPTPPTADPEEVFSSLAAMVGEVMDDAASRAGPTGRIPTAGRGVGAPRSGGVGRRGPTGRIPTGRIIACGVGCGGPMTPGGTAVSPLHIPAWRRFPLPARMEALLGLPTFCDNDAKALTLGEGWVGAAAGESCYVGMVVSTGVGGGIVLDGRLLEGGSGNAGHIGHMVVEPDGRPCACGGRGCLEAEASGRAIEAMTGRPAAQATPEVVARTGRLVGRALASVANLCDLRLAVVGGSVA
ncbi:MAG: ROK family protein, partial [Acidimicrobiia bacterium]